MKKLSYRSQPKSIKIPLSGELPPVGISQSSREKENGGSFGIIFPGTIEGTHKLPESEMTTSDYIKIMKDFVSMADNLDDDNLEVFEQIPHWIFPIYGTITSNLIRALLLDKNGFISEGSGENIFLVNEKTISTPKTDHCLNGITRQSVIQIAQDFGFDVIERDISYDELIASDEVFFSGTAVEITPISKIDETIIGSGSIGPVTEKLQTAYADIVSGRNDQYRNWLSIVSE